MLCRYNLRLFGLEPCPGQASVTLPNDPGTLGQGIRTGRPHVGAAATSQCTLRSGLGVPRGVAPGILAAGTNRSCASCHGQTPLSFGSRLGSEPRSAQGPLMRLHDPGPRPPQSHETQPAVRRYRVPYSAWHRMSLTALIQQHWRRWQPERCAGPAALL